MPSPTNVKTSVANLALSHIKQTNFLSSDNDDSEQCQVINLWYDRARRAALRAAHWHFAEKNVQLVLLGDISTATENPTVQADQDILPGWIYTYSYPSNCLKIRCVYSPNFGDYPDVLVDPFRDQSLPIKMVKEAEYNTARSPITDAMAIGTNLQLAWVKYTFDETDLSRFDDMCIDAFALELAVRICLPLTADKELYALIESARVKIAGEAKRINGGEGTEKVPGSTRYLDVRT